MFLLSVQIADPLFSQTRGSQRIFVDSSVILAQWCIAILQVGDLVWMDSRHTPNDIPFKLTARWFRPFTVLQVKGAQATLDLPSTFGKAHRQVNIARLKFFEPRDSTLGDANLRPQPLWGHDGVPH